MNSPESKPSRPFFSKVELLAAAVVFLLGLCWGFTSLMSSTSPLNQFVSVHYLQSFFTFALIFACLLTLLYIVFRICLKYESSKARRVRRRYERKRLTTLRRKQSLEAQLNKPDFESRLQNFTGTPATEEPFVSKAVFWQLENDYQPSRPRSTSFIRNLLIRISKYVNKSKMS